MAQHDMNIANQGFPATRADLNNALQAIATNNSGTSAPSTTFANQWFYNESSNKLFIRNEANNAFIEVATLDQTNNEWQITTGVIQAKDSDGLALKTDDGTTRLFIADADGAITMGSATLSTDGNEDTLVLKSNDADANAGPKLQFNRNSASPADDDLLGEIRFDGRNDAGQAVEYAKIAAKLQDASDGTEDIRLSLKSIVAGTERERVTIQPTEVVINEDSQDLDFRVESDGNANMFVVDGGNDIVGIGRAPDSNDGGAGSLQLEGTDGMAMRRPSQTNSFIMRPIGSGDGMRFTQGGTGDVGAWDANGSFIVNATSSGDVGNGSASYIGNNGQLYASSTSTHFVNKTADGNVLAFRSAGTTEGTVSISGTTTTYNGGHLGRWSQLTDGSKDTSIVKGTVMTNLDQMAVWSHAAIAEGDEIKDNMGNTITATSDHVRDAFTEENEQLNCMAVSSVEGDPNVAGVFVNWDYFDDGFNDMNVAMTGDMVIRIAKGTTVARGDLLMSAGDGTAKPQGDDIVRSKTIAKVTSTNVSHTYDDESYLVPCVLMGC